MRKFLILILILTFNLTLIGCGLTKESEDKIIATYKELDALDFKAQEIVKNDKEVDKLLKKTYIEPALSEHKEGIQLMKENDIKLVHYQSEYKDIEVIKKTDDQVVLKVQASHNGDKFTISSPFKNLGPYSFDFNAEVTMKKVKDKWYISRVIPIDANK